MVVIEVAGGSWWWLQPCSVEVIFVYVVVSHSEISVGDLLQAMDFFFHRWS